MSHRFVVLPVAILLSTACGELESADSRQIRRRPAEVMAEYQGFARRTFDGERARDFVAFMDQYVRLPGNEGFDASIMKVIEELEAAGYRNEAEGIDGALTYRLERRPLERPTWEPVTAALQIVGEVEPLLRFETNRNVVAINSFSTPAGGVEAEVVDVGAGSADDFSGIDVRGKIVFGEMRVGRLFDEAVGSRGALGVISYSVPSVNRPDENRDIISYSSIPQDPDARSWGLQLTTNARDRLREALAAGPVRVWVEVDARIFESEELTLVADVRGTSRPEERFVFSGHVQEAGANDNASGVAALSEVARLFAVGVQSGEFSPDRTISMIWGDEISDTDKTGGTFLIEKMPDPSAVWTRGDDHHSEWGGRPMTVDQLTPHYFNDFVLNRCLDQGADNGWVVRTNPYEGGSDHVPFLRAGLPGLLLWHFTDVFYHTDGDRVANVSAETLENVGVCAAVSAMTLATADADITRFLVDEVQRAAIERIGAEGRLSVAAVEAGADVAEQHLILETWTSWYEDALATMMDVEVGGSSEATSAHIATARTAVAEAGRRAGEALGGGR